MSIPIQTVMKYGGMRNFTTKSGEERTAYKFISPVNGRYQEFNVLEPFDVPENGTDCGCVMYVGTKYDREVGKYRNVNNCIKSVTPMV